MPSTKRPLVIVPTYNEKDNVGPLLDRLLNFPNQVDVLFVDDNSPDGTGVILDKIASHQPRLFVHHRPGREGIGSAHRAGLKWAYDQGYSRVVTMDCDFTHPPEHIAELLAALPAADVSVGSRYILSDSLSDWNLYRRFLTRLGHFLTERVLKVPYDATGGFRAYNIDAIPYPLFEMVQSRGYSFLFESLFLLKENLFRIVEIPIRLPKRTYGSSKMTFAEIRRSLTTLFRLARGKFIRPERFHWVDPNSSETKTLIDPQNWDAYWDKKSSKTGWAYEVIAAFYRKFIIRPLLNHFALKHFSEGSSILHAGCGSGQVDEDIRDHLSITGMDISPSALHLYRRSNGYRASTLYGSIFDIPAPDENYDGIYNLGVMEHFSLGENERILAEFHRVLRPGGKVILFWPPEFGTSVVFLKGVHFVLNSLLDKNVKLHPDEVSRVQSKAEIVRFVESQGFEVSEYYFGPRDLFTYAVIAATKREKSSATDSEKTVAAKERTKSPEPMSRSLNESSQAGISA